MIILQNFTNEKNLSDKGVYMISHNSTNLQYVGSTYCKNGFAGRWRAHLNGFLHNKGNKVLLNIYHKYGIEEFNFLIIERLTNESEIRKREAYWISFYDTYKNGANCTLNTECAFENFKRQPNTEVKKELYRRTSPSKKTVYVYNKEGKLSFTFNSSVACDRYFKLKKGRTNWKINHPLRSINKIFYPSYEIKNWVPEKEKELNQQKRVLKTTQTRKINNSYKSTKEQKVKSRMSHKNRIKVELYDLHGNFIQNFNSLNECDDFLQLTRGATSKVLKGLAKTLKRKYIPKIIY